MQFFAFVNIILHAAMYFLLNAHIYICCLFCHGTANMQKCSQYIMVILLTDPIAGATLTDTCFVCVFS